MQNRQTVPDNTWTPPVWNNPDLILWHGTTQQDAQAIESGMIKVNFGEVGKDFGRGFYTTTIRSQAETWASLRVARRERRRLPYQPPAVVRLVLSRARIAELAFLAFILGERDGEDFWSFVRYCRSGAVDHRLPGVEGFRQYDVVSGPLVSDWEYRRLWANRDQISFHTPEAESMLNKHANRKMMEIR